MFFLTFSKADVRFAEWEFVQRTYIAAEALPTTRKMEIIDRKEFAIAALNADNKTFIVHIAALVEPTIMPIYFFSQAQVTLLTSEKTGIPAEYFNFSNVFFLDSTA